MARGKGKNSSGEGVSYDGASSSSNGGISFFQILLFFLATTSIAINVGIIYGAIPIQGRYNNFNKLKNYKKI